MNNNTSIAGSRSNQNRALRIKFTVEAFDQLPIPEVGQGRIMYYDAKTSGLVLSVSATGKKVFHFYRKVKNIPRRLQIGPFPEWTIDQARRQAAKYNAEVARGIPPGEERRFCHVCSRCSSA